MATQENSADADTVAELRKKYQRDINCLSDPDRTSRKRALIRLQEDFFDSATNNKKSLDRNVLVFFKEYMEKVLICTVVADDVEKCRELGLDTLYDFIKFHLSLAPTEAEPADLEALKSFAEIVATDFIDIANKRIGVIPFVEVSEELRLRIIQVLILIVKSPLCKEPIQKDLGKLTTTLSRALTDAAPDVKRQCALCIQQLCSSEFFESSIHLYMKQLVKPLLENMFHQRAKVRQDTLGGLAAVVKSCGLYGDREVFDKAMAENIIPMLSKSSRDNSAGVRTELLKQASIWISIFTDTSYTKDLLLLLTAGLSDPAREVQQFALENIEKSGETIKIPVDYSDSIFTPGDSELYYPEPFSSRPPEGIRNLFKHHLRDIVPLLLKQSEDWTTQGRLNALALLRTVLVFAEDKITLHLDGIVLSLCESFRDDDKDVIALAKDCSRLVGQYTKLENGLYYLVPKCLGNTSNQDDTHVSVQDSASARLGALSMLSNVLFGTPTLEKKENVEKIMEVLSDELLCELGLESYSLLGELLRCLQELILRLEKENDDLLMSDEVKQKTVKTLLFLISLGNVSEEQLQDIATAADVTLSKFAPNEKHLIATFSKPILDEILDNKGASQSQKWTKASIERRVFDQLVRKCIQLNISGIDEFFTDMINVLEKSCSTAADADLRLCQLSLLQSFIADQFQFENNVLRYKKHIIFNILMPNLVWRVGRVASTIRKITMFALGTFLGKLTLTTEKSNGWLLKDVAQIMPSLKSSLDDFEADTRMFTCQSLGFIFVLLLNQQQTLDPTIFHDIYHPLVCRFDDAQDLVRIAACKAIDDLIKCTDKSVLRGTAIKYIVESCFVHLDDRDKNIQQAVYKVLETIVLADIDTPTVRVHAEKERTRHRSPEFCDMLLNMKK